MKNPYSLTLSEICGMFPSCRKLCELLAMEITAESERELQALANQEKKIREAEKRRIEAEARIIRQRREDKNYTFKL